MSHCLFPKEIRNPQYSDISPLPWRRSPIMTVPCGKCVHCKANKIDEWKTRLKHEISTFGHAYFCTVTYDDEHIPFDENNNPTFIYRDFQLFMKRLRKKLSNIDPSIRISYFVVSEYGDLTGRPHYHFILFGLPIYDSYKFRRYSKKSGKWELRTRVPYVELLLQQTWKNGTIVEAGLANQQCVSYMVDYMFKSGEQFPERTKEFHRMSTRPFIGYSWFLKNHSKFEEWKYRWREDKFSHRLPRIYLKKFFILYGHDSHIKYQRYCYEFRIRSEQESIDNYNKLLIKYKELQISDSDFEYYTNSGRYIQDFKQKRNIRRRKLQNYF